MISILNIFDQNLSSSHPFTKCEIGYVKFIPLYFNYLGPGFSLSVFVSMFSRYLYIYYYYAVSKI